MTNENAIEILKANQLKVTEQRQQVLQCILQLNSVFSANLLKENLPSAIDTVTVYRILGAFVKKKIIRKISSKENTRLYELSCSLQKLHPHFLCKKCNRVFCLEAVDIAKIPALNQHLLEFTVEDISLQISGLCPRCQTRS